MISTSMPRPWARAQPTKSPSACHVPEPVLGEPDQNAVDQDAAVGPAGHPVGAAAGLHLRHVAGEQAIENALGVRPAELGGKLAGVEPHDAPAQRPVGPEPVGVGHGDRHHAPVVDDPGGPVHARVAVEGRALVAVVPPRFLKRADDVAPGDEMASHGCSFPKSPASVRRRGNLQRRMDGCDSVPKRGIATDRGRSVPGRRSVMSVHPGLAPSDHLHPLVLRVLLRIDDLMTTWLTFRLLVFVRLVCRLSAICVATALTSLPRFFSLRTTSM